MVKTWLIRDVFRHAGTPINLYYFTLKDGERSFGRREATEFAGLAEVQEEAIAFGRSVLKHRFLLGIEDISLCAVHISNELDRVLAILPLSRVKRMRSSTQHLPAALPIGMDLPSPHFSHSMWPALPFGEADTASGGEKRIGPYG